jgi:hypothetical protein
MQQCITVVCGSLPLLGVKIIHLVDKAGLFKISNLVQGGKEILLHLYSTLGGTETERESLGWVW